MGDIKKPKNEESALAGHCETGGVGMIVSALDLADVISNMPEKFNSGFNKDSSHEPKAPPAATPKGKNKVSCAPSRNK